MALDTGLVVKQPYDPDKHTGYLWGDPEPGDDIYMLASDPDA